MSEDMSNLMNQISQMMQNNQIPNDIKNMVNQFKNSSDSNVNQQDSAGNPKRDDNSNSSDDVSSAQSPNFDFDIGTMMKMKQIIDSMNSNKNDPRANLLLSLKPYLKESRKEKVDQYIQIFKMGKVFEMLGPLGGEKKT